jgi:putative transposase
MQQVEAASRKRDESHQLVFQEFASRIATQREQEEKLTDVVGLLETAEEVVNVLAEMGKLARQQQLYAAAATRIESSKRLSIDEIIKLSGFKDASVIFAAGELTAVNLRCLTPSVEFSMPRQLRLNVAEGVYHVTQRGLERRNIVLCDDDRQDWFRLLDRHATRCQWRVFAYALLDNHFHLFLRTPEPNLSDGMHGFESGYVTLFNRRHARTGPLFQGRFGTVLVEYETHARALTRYVHLNPFRAGLDCLPGNYRWCSYRFYLNPNGSPAWLDWRTILAELSLREAAARAAYRRFVEEGTRGQIENPLNGVTDAGLLGSDQFIMRNMHVEHAPQYSEIKQRSADRGNNLPVQRSTFGEPDIGRLLDRLVQAVAVEFEVEVAAIRQRGRHHNRARQAVIWLAHEFLKRTHGEIAELLGDLSESAVRDSLRRTQLCLNEPAGTVFRTALIDVERRLLSGK